jgi:hypothetical protein
MKEFGTGVGWGRLDAVVSDIAFASEHVDQVNDPLHRANSTYELTVLSSNVAAPLFASP